MVLVFFSLQKKLASHTHREKKKQFEIEKIPIQATKIRSNASRNQKRFIGYSSLVALQLKQTKKKKHDTRGKLMRQTQNRTENSKKKKKYIRNKYKIRDIALALAQVQFLYQIKPINMKAIYLFVYCVERYIDLMKIFRFCFFLFVHAM